SVVVRGTGTVTLPAAVNGNGMLFTTGGQQNSNTAFLQFSGAAVGNVFNVNQGDITFYLKSSYTFAARLALPSYNYRYAFDVNDGTNRLFNFGVYASSGRLGFTYATGSTAANSYRVPAGQEDATYGQGVIMKIRLVWNGTQNSLYVNDVLVQQANYTKGTPSWGSASAFTIGATCPPLYGGGDYASDDAIAEFSMAAPGGGGAAPAVSLDSSSLTFTSQNVGTTSPSQSVTLTNTGNAALSIS